MIDATELLDAIQGAKVSMTMKPWGYECVVDAEDFLLKFIRVNPGECTALHYHDEKDELCVIVNTDDENRGLILRTLTSGFTAERDPDERIVRVKPGMVHRAVGPLDMIEVTTHHPDDITRLADEYGRA